MIFPVLGFITIRDVSQFSRTYRQTLHSDIITVYANKYSKLEFLDSLLRASCGPRLQDILTPACCAEGYGFDSLPTKRASCVLLIMKAAVIAVVGIHCLPHLPRPTKPVILPG